MKELKLVKINTKYCDYLRQFDSKVPYNYDKKEIRPFVGALFYVNDFAYFAPLSSPKPKHKKLRNKLDFLKIDDGNLGAINFNNMIPVTENNIKYIYFDNTNEIDDDKYMKLLEKQYRWLNVNSEKIYNNSKKLYNKYVGNRLTKNIKDRCCNYLLLEEKCIEYNKSKILQEV